MSKYYIGVKVIFAWPEEKNGNPGYHVRYPDGYESWSPAGEFEKAYFPIGDSDTNTVTENMVNRFIGWNCQSRNLEDNKTTLVMVKAISGFVMYETSSCVDPSNYSEQLGTEICMKRIRDKMWAFLGFVFQWGKFGLKN